MQTAEISDPNAVKSELKYRVDKVDATIRHFLVNVSKPSAHTTIEPITDDVLERVLGINAYKVVGPGYRRALEYVRQRIAVLRRDGLNKLRKYIEEYIKAKERNPNTPFVFELADFIPYAEPVKKEDKEEGDTKRYHGYCNLVLSKALMIKHGKHMIGYGKAVTRIGDALIDYANKAFADVDEYDGEDDGDENDDNMDEEY